MEALKLTNGERQLETVLSHIQLTEHTFILFQEQIIQTPTTKMGYLFIILKMERIPISKRLDRLLEFYNILTIIIKFLYMVLEQNYHHFIKVQVNALRLMEIFLTQQLLVEQIKLLNIMLIIYTKINSMVLQKSHK